MPCVYPSEISTPLSGSHERRRNLTVLKKLPFQTGDGMRQKENRFRVLVGNG